ncbi:PAS domain-containing protein [Pseudomonas sp. S9]|uniref:PAS domain-containing protein n=1 Tax=Pseudomonas sp. S9 TaxID=686578 RepID=UPI0002556961|nr:PAS domain-containing protein [Pseudomonas sp. S9]
MSDELDRILDALPGVAFTARADGGVDFVNSEWCAYTGISRQAALNSGWHKCLHPDDLNQLLENWQVILSTGEPCSMQARLQRFDGHYRRFVLQIKRLDANRDGANNWCAVGTDIEDYLDARPEHQVDATSIIDSIPAMVSFMTADGELERVNRQIEDYLGSTYEELRHWAATDSVHCDDLPMVIAAWTHSVQTGEPYDIEHRIRRADGVYQWFHVRGLPIRDPEGRITRWCVLQVNIDERKRDKILIANALADVRASENNLSKTINAVPGFLWSAAPDGGVIFINQRWCDYTGISLENARGIGWTASIHPDDAETLGTYWHGLLQSGQQGEFEARLRRFDGVYRWFLIRAMPQYDEAGTLLRWYGENTDIEDRKQAEMLLAGEKHLLAMMAANSPLAPILDALCELVESMFAGSVCSIVLTDPKRPSPSHEEPIRLQPGAGPKVPASLMPSAEGSLASPDSCPIAWAIAAIEPVISADLNQENRWPEWCNTALQHDLKANWSIPIYSTATKVIGVLSVLYPEPKQPSSEQANLLSQFTHLASIAINRAWSDAALKQSEAFLAKGQQLSATGTFAWRVSTDTITWSDEIYRILEVDQGVIPSFDLIYSRTHPDDISMLKDVVRRQREHDRDFELEQRLLLPSGMVKHLHLVAHAIKDEDGELEYIGALQDITRRKLYEEALGKVRSELAHLARVASLGTVTASIAHEVNQPLAGIITNASTCLRMLSATPPNVAGALETARRTIRDGNRASDVIKRLRALFTNRNITLENVNLSEAAREVVAMLTGELKRNGVVLQTRFAEPVPIIKGDRVQLQQVILNLIMNAIEVLSKITSRPRHVVVSTTTDEDRSVHFAVQDNGSGFESADAERIFDAFYTTKSSGMGIGLAISRSIIEQHGGQLWATLNDGPGATLRFSITQQADSSTPDLDANPDHTKEDL